MRRLCVGRGEEDGSALVLALVFITVVSLLISVTLTFAAISVKYGDELTTGRRSLYTADGLIEAAIGQIANGSAVCGGDFEFPELNGLEADAETAVGCEPSPVEGTPLTRPKQAILTVGADAGEGLFQEPGGARLDVDGDIFSNGEIFSQATPTAIAATGTISAATTCGGGPTSPPCEPGVTTPTAVPDLTPLFDGDAGVVPPSCPSGVFTLTPGVYTSADALTALTNASLCSAPVVHLTPGLYYFDFTGASKVWQISDPNVRVVGGTLSSTPTIVPGSCKLDAAGVELVFGGESQVVQTGGFVELCPTPSASGQQVSIFGLDETPEPFLTPTTTPTATGFIRPDDALAIEAGTTADFAEANLAPGESATMTVSGFVAPFSDGFELSDVKLRVSHREFGGVAVRADVMDANGAVLGSWGPLESCSIDDFCPPPDSLSFDSLPTKQQLVGASVRYSADASGPGYTYLDGVDFDLTYAAAPRALDLCLGCPLIEASGGNLVLHGTVYAPTAAIDVQQIGLKAPIFGRGVVAETLHIAATPDASYSGPAVRVPRTSRPALMALGLGEADGITQASGSGELVIRGDVVSRTDITATAGLDVRGDVRAIDGCSGPILATGEEECGLTALGPLDPRYPRPPPTLVSGTTPCAAGWRVPLSPGIYNSASQLSDLTDGVGPCAGKVVHFQPGTYYFAFDGDGPCADGADADCTWTIDDPDMKVVGGAPLGWEIGDPDDAGVRFPGACDPEGAGGVTFVFEGRSRLDVKRGSLELCAGTPADREAIALYGITGTPDPPVTPTATGAFVPDSAAAAIDDTAGSASFLVPSDDALTTFSAFGSSSIPNGSAINSVTLSVAHSEDHDDFALALVTPTAGAVFEPAELPSCVTLPGFCTNAVKVDGLTADELDDFSFGYEATLEAGGTAASARLDGVRLDVRYTPPNPDPTFKASSPAKVAVHGVTYLPAGGVDVNLTEVSTPIFGREVIARKITIGAIPATGYSGLVATAPNDAGSPGIPPGDLLTASIKGRTEFFRVRLKARVEFERVYGRQTATIRSWSVIP